MKSVIGGYKTYSRKYLMILKSKNTFIAPIIINGICNEKFVSRGLSFVVNPIIVQPITPKLCGIMLYGYMSE